MTDQAIHTEGLTKRFKEFVAVEDLDFDVQDGTVVALLGPNGAGKTTTVRMLATLLCSTSRSRSSTATKSPKRLVRPCASIAGGVGAATATTLQ